MDPSFRWWCWMFLNTRQDRMLAEFLFEPVSWLSLPWVTAESKGSSYFCAQKLWMHLLDGGPLTGTKRLLQLSSVSFVWGRLLHAAHTDFKGFSSSMQELCETRTPAVSTHRDLWAEIGQKIVEGRGGWGGGVGGGWRGRENTLLFFSLAMSAVFTFWYTPTLQRLLPRHMGTINLRGDAAERPGRVQ